MADAVVHVNVTNLEPFKRFIGKVAEAHAAFYGMTVEEAKALPDSAVRGVMAVQEALRSLGAEVPSAVRGASGEHDCLDRAAKRAAMESPGRTA